MKISFYLSLLVSGFLSTSTLALATGHETGNGGGAVVCRDRQKKIISAEVLDLWEARILNQPLLNRSLTVEQWIEVALKRIAESNPLFGGHVRQALIENQKILSSIPEGTSLVSPTDARNYLMKENCALEGAAEYLNRSQGAHLFFNPEIVNQMAPIDQAALWIHEAIYKVLRDEDGDQDSIRTRDMVAQIFGSKEIPRIATQLSFACFHEAKDDFNTFAFSFFAAVDHGTLRGWITRVDEQWQFPPLVTQPAIPGDDKDFVEHFLLRNSPVESLELPPFLTQLYQYRVNGQIRHLTAVLAKSNQPYNFLYELAVFPKSRSRARCTVY